MRGINTRAAGGRRGGFGQPVQHDVREHEVTVDPALRWWVPSVHSSNFSATQASCPAGESIGRDPEGLRPGRLEGEAASISRFCSSLALSSG